MGPSIFVDGEDKTWDAEVKDLVLQWERSIFVDGQTAQCAERLDQCALMGPIVVDGEGFEEIDAWPDLPILQCGRRSSSTESTL